MKKNVFIIIAILVCLPGIMMAQSKKSGETEDFRRSSLCLMLITHQGDEYAKAIEKQFMEMPLPNRYNDLNVDVRVFSTASKNLKDKEVEQLLRNSHVAKDLVGKWFNRNTSGVMNMERIHQWGGYNANFSDLKRAQDMERGVALLSDEGTELVKNTFVMVCDISYYDRRATGTLLSAIFTAAASMLDQNAQEREAQGKNSEILKSLTDIADASAIASEDLGGFSVNVMARLYRLKWDNDLCNKFYNNYWVDDTTPAAELTLRKNAFDNDNTSFDLEYLGFYHSRSGKTVSVSQNNLEWVIQDVCSEAVDKSINNLAKMFPVFKTKTSFYCDGDNVYAYVGTKEGVNMKSKFEVLQTKKTKDGITYERVATLKPTQVWDNAGKYIYEDSLEMKYKGTQFTHTGGRSDICDQGLLLREMGTLGYQYKKRNWFYVDAIVGQSWVTDGKKESVANDSKFSFENLDDLECNTMVYGFETGWVINYHTNYAWNVINLQMLGGSKGNRKDGMQSITELSAGTGVILRTPPFGKKGNFSFFVWPTIGVVYADNSLSYSISRTINHSRKGKTWTENYHDTKTGYWDGLELGWSVKLGMSITEKIFVAGHIGNYHKGLTLGVFL